MRNLIERGPVCGNRIIYRPQHLGDPLLLIERWERYLSRANKRRVEVPLRSRLALSLEMTGQILKNEIEVGRIKSRCVYFLECDEAVMNTRVNARKQRASDCRADAHDKIAGNYLDGCGATNVGKILGCLEKPPVRCGNIAYANPAMPFICKPLRVLNGPRRSAALYSRKRAKRNKWPIVLHITRHSQASAGDGTSPPRHHCAGRSGLAA